MAKLRNLSSEEWEQLESKEHDIEYKNSLPFDSQNYKIDVQHVIWWEDYCYKKGRRKDRGHRTKRLFELMNIKDIQGKRILDVGCGNGQYSVFFALQGAEVYGIDITPVGIDVAKKIAVANNVENQCYFSVQNIANTDFKTDFFDIVIMHEVLHHAIKYPGVKEEIIRILKHNGVFICADGLSGNPLFSLGRIFTMRGIESKGDVVLKISDYKEFVKDFSEYQIELMSLFYMGKRIFKNSMDYALIRWFMYLLKKTDDILFALFPFLKKYCGEVIIIAKK